MKLVHTAKHPTEAHMVRGMLEADGIKAEVRNDLLYGAFGELPVLPTVWILDDGLTTQAHEVVLAFLRGIAERKYGHERWVCAQCGEILQGQFTSCWQCGTQRSA